jgi:Iap family predicted aminopeptidase
MRASHSRGSIASKLRPRLGFIFDRYSTAFWPSKQLPTYNAYSRDGDVTGELVYVNYWIPADYEELALRGIDVKGKVVIARYGGSWRGIKPKVAGEHGAVGCIIWKLVTAYDVIAMLPGAERPDEWVIRGNHHDAWVNGAADPVSGLVALLEEARAVGELARNGFRPRRTLVYAAWDGEEQRASAVLSLRPLPARP